MEACDGLLSAGNHRLLTGDGTQVGDCAVKKLLVASGTTYTHVNNDLLKTRDLINISETELLEKLVAYFVYILFLQTRSSHCPKKPFSMN